MEYYQKAAEAQREGNEYPLRLLKNAGLTAATTAAGRLGVRAAGKLVPAIGALISKYVPDELSKAGLKKLDPRMGKFIDGGLKEGYAYEDIRKNLEERVEKTQEQEQEQPQQSKNIVEQYSPELHSFISDQIKKGRNAYQAGAIASKDKRFADAIKKLTKDHGLPWHDILTQIYGGDGVQKKQGMMQQEDARFQTGYGDQLDQQGQQGQQQPGQGSQALMAILQKINQTLGQ